jgi:hypothetical protein
VAIFVGSVLKKQQVGFQRISPGLLSFPPDY